MRRSPDEDHREEEEVAGEEMKWRRSLKEDHHEEEEVAGEEEMEWRRWRRRRGGEKCVVWVLLPCHVTDPREEG